MTKNELIKALERLDPDKVVIIEDGSGGWSNIDEVVERSSLIAIKMDFDLIFTSDKE